MQRATFKNILPYLKKDKTTNSPKRKIIKKVQKKKGRRAKGENGKKEKENESGKSKCD